MNQNLNRFTKLGYDDFKKMALDSSLSTSEKIGFPNEYREGKEQLIINDILSKIPVLNEAKKLIVDIGPGCSELISLIIEHCQNKSSKLVLIDSAEMLSLLPNLPHLRKVAAFYPNCDDLLQELKGRVDVILCYSVFHYIFEETNTWNFFDHSLSLLSPGGTFLIGDIPNSSMRKRFFNSEAGVKFHKNFMQTDEAPKVQYNQVDHGSIDDSVLIALLLRARSFGFNAYLLPQASDLPMANRREDLLIIRP